MPFNSIILFQHSHIDVGLHVSYYNTAYIYENKNTLNVETENNRSTKDYIQMNISIFDHKTTFDICRPIWNSVYVI